MRRPVSRRDALSSQLEHALKVQSGETGYEKEYHWQGEAKGTFEKDED